MVESSGGENSRIVAVVEENDGNFFFFGCFCFHALGDTKQKKPTLLNLGPPLHVNRVLEKYHEALCFPSNILHKHCFQFL